MTLLAKAHRPRLPQRSPRPRRRALAVVVAVLIPALPVAGGGAADSPGASLPGGAVDEAAGAPQGNPPADLGGVSGPALPAPDCLAATLCRLKDRVRWGTPAWTPATCQRVADAVLGAAQKYQLSPALILAVMLNESDLDEKASVPYLRDGRVFAKDGGLMGIRCVFDRRGRCGNGHVQGLSFRSIMDPARNVELGARALAYFRDEGGVERQVTRQRGPDGAPAARTRLIRCRHRSHAWWAHYNHGSFYISRGYARHYPHRVAVLYHAFARALGLPAPDLERGRITVRDAGLRPRAVDRPVEARYRVLYDKIAGVSGSCGPAAPLARRP